jgi:hypothetical protein
LGLNLQVLVEIDDAQVSQKKPAKNCTFQTETVKFSFREWFGDEVTALSALHYYMS